MERDNQVWQAILAEYKSLYKAVDFIEQPKVFHHRAEVINNIEQNISDLKLKTSRPAGQKPVCNYLPQLLAGNGKAVSDSLLNLIAKIKDTLTWEYGYQQLPEELKQKYAYAEILGPRGPIVGQGLILGLVLLGPDCTYPEHSHDQIEESYLVVKGSVTLTDRDKLESGDFIYNSPGQPHELVTKQKPCLLAYAWRAKPAVLRTNTMEFSQ